MADFWFLTLMNNTTAWKVSINGVTSGPHFAVFGLNTEKYSEDGEILRISPYSVQMRENTDQKKLRIWTLLRSVHDSKWIAQFKYQS